VTSPRMLSQYRRDFLEAEFSNHIREQYELSDAQITLTSSRLADLDHDGEQDDLAGTALLRSDNRFKAVVFLRRADGETRFVETNGDVFDPRAGLRFFPCFESHPQHCADPLVRARRAIRPLRFELREFDRSLPGLELILEQGGGLRAIVNSLQIFLRP
jgi:hypothetical protein